MNINHRRPLIAFFGVTVVCALVMVQTMLYVIRSPLGGGLAETRTALSGLVGSLSLSPLPVAQMVEGDTLLGVPGTTRGITRITEPEVPPVLEPPSVVAAPPAGGAAPDTTSPA